MKFMRRRSQPPAVGTLTILAVLLIVSSILRIVGGTGQAIAQEVANLRSPGASPADLAGCEPAPDIAAVLAALADRESRLKEREAFQAERSVALADAEREITTQLAALEQAEKELEQTLTLAASASETDVGRLTAVYENMKPKDAAKLFETMDPSFAAGFLGRMRPDAAARVVGGLSPEAAYSISVILAGRNANAPKQ